jgi:hypothetical protein
MSPKEKAEEFIDKFVRYTPAEEEFEYPYAKQCALIAVDEILENFGQLMEGKEHYAAYSTIRFYQKVRNEIENYGGDK